ncbi:hypothetical protein HNQ60_002487 [Povalibacter uvarum]|uniref:DUF1840 domain-containing protein n=1 Tax=Povalibacter uvarum TaxID=732238 RepID=A0A841HL62_9GAMM|nr:DUF1840 domain-containing protein [Povalibacter uvarum]MBB6093606.1 hypothetical protein [Povalibacter uvarum]
MLVTFRSKAAASITMFGDVASQLLNMMGASGRIPGAFTGEDVQSALQKLESSLARLKEQGDHTAAPPALNEDMEAEDEEDEPPLELAVRAAPLIELLQRAAAAKAEVTWEGK